MEIFVWILAITNCLAFFRTKSWNAYIFSISFAIVLKYTYLAVGHNIPIVLWFAFSSSLITFFVAVGILINLYLAFKKESDDEENYLNAIKYIQSHKQVLQSKIPKRCQECKNFTHNPYLYCAIDPYLSPDCKYFEKG